MSESMERVESRNRYELTVDGEVVGVCTYQDDGDRQTLQHTEVAETLEGHGLGSRLVEFALDDIRRSGMRVVPQCAMVASFIEFHQEWADLQDDRR